MGGELVTVSTLRGQRVVSAALCATPSFDTPGVGSRAAWARSQPRCRRASASVCRLGVLRVGCLLFCLVPVPCALLGGHARHDPG